eukprot:6455738-Amphidinium_carterae.3
MTVIRGGCTVKSCPYSRFNSHHSAVLQKARRHKDEVDLMLCSRRMSPSQRGRVRYCCVSCHQTCCGESTQTAVPEDGTLGAYTGSAIPNTAKVLIQSLQARIEIRPEEHHAILGEVLQGTSHMLHKLLVLSRRRFRDRCMCANESAGLANNLKHD